MRIEKNHEIVGRNLADVRGLELGTLYPVVGSDRSTIIGVYSAEFGSPEGYALNEQLQAYVPCPTVTIDGQGRL